MKAPINGIKMAETYSTNLSPNTFFLFFFLFSATTSSEECDSSIFTSAAVSASSAATAASFFRFVISVIMSYTLTTSVPITTCVCPLASNAFKTPLIFVISSRSALLLSFNIKRSRVTQCVKESIFSAPPTFSNTSFAIAL